jgi:hypothetical protein
LLPRVKARALARWDELLYRLRTSSFDALGAQHSFSRR